MFTFSPCRLNLSYKRQSYTFFSQIALSNVRYCFASSFRNLPSNRYLRFPSSVILANDNSLSTASRSVSHLVITHAIKSSINAIQFPFIFYAKKVPSGYQKFTKSEEDANASSKTETNKPKSPKVRSKQKESSIKSNEESFVRN